MKLDLEYEKWKEKNEEHIKEKFLDTHDFHNYLEEMWRGYQIKNNLIDESNEVKE